MTTPAPRHVLSLSSDLIGRLGRPLFEGEGGADAGTGGGAGGDGGGGSTATPPKAPASGGTSEEEKRELEELRNHWKNTKVLMDEMASQEAQRQASISLMRANGLSDEQIQKRLRAMEGTQDDGGDGTPPNKKKAPREEDEDGELSEIQKLREELEEVTGTIRETSRNQLQHAFDTTLETVLDKHPGVRNMLEAMARANPEASKTGQQKTLLASKIEKAAKELLRDRRSKGLSIDPKIFGDVMGRAASAVLDEYKLVTGDLDRLGRAPTAHSEEDEFLDTKPVERPTYKPGTNPSVLEANLKNFITDHLRRGDRNPEGAKSTV